MSRRKKKAPSGSDGAALSESTCSSNTPAKQIQGAPVAQRYRPHHKFIGSFVPNWLMERRDISQGAKLCFGRLCRYAGRGLYAFPKIALLGKELGVGTRNAKKYLRELSDAKLIEIVRTGGASHYFFLTHPWIRERDADGNNSSSHNLPRSHPEGTEVPLHIRESGKEPKKKKGLSVWEAGKKRDEIDAEIARIQASSENYDYKLISEGGKQLRPSVKKRIAELREERTRLTGAIIDS